jgi:hypothetical protein
MVRFQRLLQFLEAMMPVVSNGLIHGGSLPESSASVETGQ